MRSHPTLDTLLLIATIGPAALGQGGSAGRHRFNTLQRFRADPFLYLGNLGDGVKALDCLRSASAYHREPASIRTTLRL